MAKNRRSSGSGLAPAGTAKRGHPDAAGGSQGTGKRALGQGRVVRSTRSGRMVEAVLHAAAGEGLTTAKDGRIAGRVSSELIARAKARTGLTSDTELLEFALASVAIEDGFADAFHAVRGTIDPDIDLGV